MPFDDQEWQKQAVQGDLGSVALAASYALNCIVTALKNIKDGQSIDEQIEEIEAQSKWLDEMFDNLTGYTPE